MLSYNRQKRQILTTDAVFTIDRKEKILKRAAVFTIDRKDKYFLLLTKKQYTCFRPLLYRHGTTLKTDYNNIRNQIENCTKTN